MRKLLLAVLAAAAVIGFTTEARAVTGEPMRQEVEQVRFITSAAANDNGGIVDSVIARRVGAAGASSVLDTTKAISTQGWLSATSVPLLADTTSRFFTLLVYDAQGSNDECESGADSLAVALQVSPDGETWVTTAAITGQAVASTTGPIVSRNNQTIVNGAFMDRLSLNGAALANGKPVWLFRYKVRGALSLHEVSEGSVDGFPFVRFILSFHDAKGYKVQAKVIFNSGMDI